MELNYFILRGHTPQVLRTGGWGGGATTIRWCYKCSAYPRKDFWRDVLQSISIFFFLLYCICLVICSLSFFSFLIMKLMHSLYLNL